LNRHPWAARARSKDSPGLIGSEKILARHLHYAFRNFVPMAQTLQHHLSLAGTSITKAVRFGCAVMRPVAISNWNKTAGAGFEV